LNSSSPKPTKSKIAKSSKSAKPLALIIDDEESICESLAGVLSDEGWRSVTAVSGMQGAVAFKVNPPDIVFLDVWMPGMDGIDTLQTLKQIKDDVPVVIMSGHATIETAVKATKLGAFDFLEKPLSLDKILPMIDHATQMRKKRVSGHDPIKSHDIIGESTSVKEIIKQISMVAPRNAWVLITGENGTGKEVVAMNIHLQSSRAQKPFIAVNCAAIPEELIESELFGHIKGAFTGAVANQKGKFELADRGTLFLDEIADMSLKTQAKILRVLQEQQFEKIGDDESVKVDVRVIAATNKDLAQEIEDGTFREDLYYRLNVIPFHVDPLRERTGDIPLLVNHFLRQMSVELNEPPKTISSEVMRILEEYAWPGNVRELKNLVERLSIMTQGLDVAVSDLPDSVTQGERRGQETLINISGSSLKEAKSDFEKSFILGKLEENSWNISKTAEAIGIERSNLHRKLRAYNIDPKELKG
jgi:two-component system, NtrC family, nitrogen regulation response regulator NtrX